MSVDVSVLLMSCALNNHRCHSSLTMKMTNITKPYISPRGHFTVNRGVEARENEIANIGLEAEPLSSSRALTECSQSHPSGPLAAGDAPTLPSSPPSICDQSASYVKVVVQKQRGRAGTRLPAASSPTAVYPCKTTPGGENNTVPATVFLACPAFAALHQQSWDKARSLLDTGKQVGTPFPGDMADGKYANSVLHGKDRDEKKSRTSFWKKMCDTKRQGLDLFDSGPDRIEVYHFEKTNEYLCARDATRITHVERAARYLRRPATALLSELLAVPRVLIAVPVAIVLQIERCLLLGVRSVMTGALEAASDQLLKPTLALAFNAVVQPPLVFATQTASALREVMRPLTLALADVLEPFTRLVSSLRLIHIERRCTCTQQV